MLIALSYASSAIGLLLTVLLLGFGVWLNRRLGLNLRSLRWVVIYFGLSLVLGFITPIILGLSVDTGNLPFGWTSRSFISIWQSAASIPRSIGRFILILMVFAEVVPLLARNSPDAQSKGLDPLALIRTRMTTFGYVVIALVLTPIAVPGIILALP